MLSREPIFTSETPFNYAPLLTQMLTQVKNFFTSMTVFDVPFVAAVAASLACRCYGVSLSTEQLRSSVQTQILSTEIILQKHAKIYKDHGLIQEILLRIENVKKWATKCQDAISFGQMMSWLKIQYVLCVRLFIHDSSILQLFAYICERIRLNGKPLPAALEVLFDDQRVSGFLFLNERPKSLEECKRGVERWSDPKGMLDNLKLTQHIFSKRCKPTVAQQIFERGGGVTHAMVKQLNNKPLEDYLNWELEPPDPIRFEAILIRAAGNIIGKDLTKSKFLSETWSFLRNKVLYQPEVEEQLLWQFMKEYVMFTNKGLELF